ARPGVGRTAAIVRGEALAHRDAAGTVHRKARPAVALSNAIDVLDVAVRIGGPFTRPAVGETTIPVPGNDTDEAQVLPRIRRHATRFFAVFVVHERLARTLDDRKCALVRFEGDPRLGRSRV